MVHSTQQPGPTPDEIDAALQSFWRGSSCELDRLIDTSDGHGPAIGSALSSVIESQWSSLIESYAIPGYSLIGEIGRGGMAIVFEAVQCSTGRNVALKLVPGFSTTRERQGRFLRHEVQTLSLLRHDGIATLFDAGETIDKCQYFAMELVAGKPLSRHFAAGPVADQADLRRRLELVLDVCNAVAYAHGRGVIHCDLKPSNVLVDERGCAKVLDFGLARLLDSDPTVSLSLGGSSLMGTLAYMSPEQATGRASDVDTRSDVYAIGVMLYELMTGRRPYDLSDALLPQAIQRITQSQPPPPSNASPLLRGDMDTIILTALAKEPARRYQSVSALAADIQRFLERRPIEARPASTTYVLGKWCSRHRLSAGLIAALLVLIVGFGAIEVRHAFQIAAQRDEARQQARRADQANAFLRSVFGRLDPKLTGADVPVVSVLDDAAGRVDEVLADNPQARAELHDTFGKGYFTLGRFISAQSEFEKATALWKTLAGESDPRFAASLHMYGLAGLRTVDSNTANDHLRRAYEIRKSLFAGDHVEIAESLQGLGMIHQHNDFPVAEDYFRKSLDMRRRLLGEHPLVAESLESLGRMMLNSGRYSEGGPLLIQAMEMRKRLQGEDAIEIAVTLGLLADFHIQNGFPEKAAEDYGGQIRIFTRAFGSKGSEIFAHALSDLAGAVADLGRFAEAEEYHKKAVAMELRCSATGNAELTEHNYATFLRMLGRYDEAEPFARSVLFGWRVLPGQKIHTGVPYASQGLGAILLEKGELEEAGNLLHRADEVWRELTGPKSVMRAPCLLGLAHWSEEMGNLNDAQKYAATAVELLSASRGDSHPQTALAKIQLGRLRSLENANGDESFILESGFQTLMQSGQPSPLAKVRARVIFGDAMLNRADLKAAELQFHAALAGLGELHLDQHPLRGDALLGLATVRIREAMPQEARRHLEDAQAIFAKCHCRGIRRSRALEAAWKSVQPPEHPAVAE